MAQRHVHKHGQGRWLGLQLGLGLAATGFDRGCAAGEVSGAATGVGAAAVDNVAPVHQDVISTM